MARSKLGNRSRSLNRWIVLLALVLLLMLCACLASLSQSTLQNLFLPPGPTVAAQLAPECDPFVAAALPTSLPAAGGGGVQPSATGGFLELPFPYDGGNTSFGGTDDQFRRAANRSALGGRINSYFDHTYPLYPSTMGGSEPVEAGAGDAVLTFVGFLGFGSAFGYSGHPALDFSTFEWRRPTTPLFAAADGMLAAVGQFADGGLYVKIIHDVQGVGRYQTMYLHLEPDESYRATQALFDEQPGRPIRAGTRIGTMGNTGHSTGHHLHFEVWFDRNGDGIFDRDERVDPFGYLPSPDFPSDPWAQSTSFVDGRGRQYNHIASFSRYLWIHPIAVSAVIPEGGGALPPLPGSAGQGGAEQSGCVPAGSVPAGSTVVLGWAPDDPPTGTLSGNGNGCVLVAVDPYGRRVQDFNPPIPIVLSFTDDEIAGTDAGTLAIHYLRQGTEGDGRWLPLNTRIDFPAHTAMALLPGPGRCALMGRPTGDRVAPVTTITLAGQPAPASASGDGAATRVFLGPVTVSLAAVDEPGGSGTVAVEYSLDGGATWQPYSQPFVVRPNGAPLPPALDVDDYESFGGRPGEFAVLAVAHDGAGNVEEPPAIAVFRIDPSQVASAGDGTPEPATTAVAASKATATAVVLPPGVSFSAEPAMVFAGEPVTLNWNVPGARAVYLDDALVPSAGSTLMSPVETVTYTLRAEMASGAIERYPLQVVVGQVSLAVQPGTIPPGGLATLKWDAQGVAQAELNSVPVEGRGERTVAPGASFTYALTAHLSSGRTRAYEVTLYVGSGVGPTPTATVGAPTPTATQATRTPTRTPGATGVAPSSTRTPAGTAGTPSPTVTRTPVGTAAPTRTPTPMSTATGTPSPTAGFTATATTSAPPSATPTPAPTDTPTAQAVTATPTPDVPTSTSTPETPPEPTATSTPGSPAGCAASSGNGYAPGDAFQFELDDPVRAAWNHADKNLTLRGYSLNSDPAVVHDLVDYGTDDPEQPPQIATLFEPARVPPLVNLYRVNEWNWAPSPEPGVPGGPITAWPVTALGLQTVPGETLRVPVSGYDIGAGMEAIVLYADANTVALRYTRDDTSGSGGYTLHLDHICTDPNLLALYNQLDDPGGPRYVFVPPELRPYSYPLVAMPAGWPIGTARGDEAIVAIVDSGAFMDTRSCREWWQIRPGYAGACQ